MAKTIFLHFSSIALLLLAACQSPVQKPMPKRDPSAHVMTNKDRMILEHYRTLKQKEIELHANNLLLIKSKNKEALAKNAKDLADLQSTLKKVEDRIRLEYSADPTPYRHIYREWRKEDQDIELGDLELYKKENNVSFSFSTFEAVSTNINLTQQVFSNSGFVRNHNGNDSENPTLVFKVSCDAPFELKYGLVKKKIEANKVFKFSLGDKKIENDFRNFILNSKVNECRFTFSANNDGQEGYSFTLKNEKQSFAKLENFMNSTEFCFTSTDTRKFIETNEFFNMTCPTQYESIDILPEPENAIEARVKQLLGQDLPADFLKNGNPYAELDFSKAPKMDAILISYLVFRADFYGTLLSRLLAYHADQGAIVRIIVSEVISLKKDKQMYERLMAQHPNIKVVRYEFDKSQKGGSYLAEFHRTNHVKIFLGYSKDNPSDSFVILGGKNVHDGFTFRKPFDVSKYPEIVDYNKDDSWAYWRDFEMMVKGQDTIESLMRHYFNFYHINKENLIMRPTSLTVRSSKALNIEDKVLRHYISIPFKDEPNLNLFYARMIDQSKKSVLISTPYFRPVKEIADALDRAIKRGVNIKIITRLDLEGDTADFIIGDVNKDGVNQFVDKVDVYEYTEPKVILHSKLLMIDDETTFISSVNLNKRSFYHDLENGVVVNDKEFNKTMRNLYAEYLKITEPIDKKLKIKFWKKALIKILDKVF